MKTMIALALVAFGLSAQAENLTGLCMVSASHNTVRNTDASALLLSRTDCDNQNGDGCGTNENSNIPWSRWSGGSAARPTG